MLQIETHLYLMEGDFETAAQLASSGLKENPEWAYFHMVLGIEEYAKGSLEESLVHLGKAAALDPYMAEIYYLKFYFLGKAGRDAEAIGALEEALRWRPDFPPAREILGMLYKNTGQTEKLKALEDNKKFQKYLEYHQCVVKVMAPLKLVSNVLQRHLGFKGVEYLGP